MRIAQVSATFPPYLGGTGNACYQMSGELARLGHDVTVFTAAMAGEPRSSSTAAGVSVRRLPRVLQLGNAPLLPSLPFGLRGFDIVHLHLPFIFGGELTWLGSLLRRFPYVASYHNDLVGFSYRRPLFRLYQDFVVPVIARRARAILTSTLDFWNASALGHRLGTRRTVELPLGVDTAHFRPDCNDSALRARYAIGEDEAVVLFVAGLDSAHEFKGLDVLLRAVAKLPGCVRCLVAGDGDLRPRYEATAAGLGIRERVTFCGAVANAELPPYYALSDVLVLPSLNTESYGLVLLEAQACARPVIASALPGVRTLVEDGRDGYLVTPGDADELAQKLDCILGDRGRAREMGLAGREKVEARYAWRPICERLTGVYEEAIAA